MFPGGANAAFTVAVAAAPVLFSYHLASHVLTITPGLPVELPTFTRRVGPVPPRAGLPPPGV